MTSIELGKTYSVRELFDNSYRPEGNVEFEGEKTVLYTRGGKVF